MSTNSCAIGAIIKQLEENCKRKCKMGREIGFPVDPGAVLYYNREEE